MHAQPINHPPDDHSSTPGPTEAEGRPHDRRSRAGLISGVVAVVLTGAIFGFFYAWVCSTMWGLDATDPRTAIEAMQAMNGSVRNAVFFPAFFLTPVALTVAALVQRRLGRREAARWFAGAAVMYLLGGILLTAAINIPMNEQLAQVGVPASRVEAQQIWTDYSGRWQLWNQVRTVASGVALVLAAIGLQRSSSTAITSSGSARRS